VSYLPRLAMVVLVVAASVAVRTAFGHAATSQASAHRRAAERSRIVGFAKRFIGVPYHYGGTSPASGFDCSGFTRFVYAHFGIVLPHYSGAQFRLGRRIAMPSLRPGDLVFFDGVGHVGIYVGRGLMIHAPRTGERVQLAPLGSNFDGARRLV
jgi:cell wall-associated NlpC family hydrolase